MTLMPLGRAACLVAGAALVLTSCGDQSTDGSTSPGTTDDSSEARPDDSAATESGSGTAEQLGDYEGLCSWASPDDLEAIFGEPMDAVGTKECRVVPAASNGSGAIYHVSLDQQSGLDQTSQNLEANQSSMGFTICDEESSRWQGMRILRRVTCPDGATKTYGPEVLLEVAPGQVLGNQPFSADSEQEAQEASQTFVELLKAFAKGGQGAPVINEVLPGQWLELYNPGSKAVDLSGATVTGYDDFDDAMSDTTELASGSTIAPGKTLVVDISSLGGMTGDLPAISVADADGRFVDLAYLDSVDKGEVKRRSAGAGVFCSFGYSDITKGAPNPAGCD